MWKNEAKVQSGKDTLVWKNVVKSSARKRHRCYTFHHAPPRTSGCSLDSWRNASKERRISNAWGSRFTGISNWSTHINEMKIKVSNRFRGICWRDGGLDPRTLKRIYIWGIESLHAAGEWYSRGRTYALRLKLAQMESFLSTDERISDIAYISSPTAGGYPDRTKDGPRERLVGDAAQRVY